MDVNVSQERTSSAVRSLYDKLEDNSFSGPIPSCPGLLSFAPTFKECAEELRSTLEDWVRVGLKL